MHVSLPCSDGYSRRQHLLLFYVHYRQCFPLQVSTVQLSADAIRDRVAVLFMTTRFSHTKTRHLVWRSRLLTTILPLSTNSTTVRTTVPAPVHPRPLTLVPVSPPSLSTHPPSTSTWSTLPMPPILVAIPAAYQSSSPTTVPMMMALRGDRQEEGEQGLGVKKTRSTSAPVVHTAATTIYRTQIG